MLILAVSESYALTLILSFSPLMCRFGINALCHSYDVNTNAFVAAVDKLLGLPCTQNRKYGNDCENTTEQHMLVVNVVSAFCVDLTRFLLA